MTTKEKPVRFLLISGKPLKEPVAWYGPIVMNTQEEIRKAFEEYNNGTFIKKKELIRINKRRFENESASCLRALRKEII